MKNALLWTITSMTAPLGALCIIGMDSQHWLPLFITLMLCILWDTLFVIANKDNIYITTYQIPTVDEEEEA